MISIPVAFLFSFALSLLLIWVVSTYGKRIGLMPKLTLSLIALQSVLIGLRWTYDYRDALLVQVTLATLIPPLVLLSMRQMVSTEAAREPVERVLLYCIPALIVLATQVLNISNVDWIIEAVFVSFGAALIYLGLAADTEWRDRVPFEGVVASSFAFMVAGSALLMSAVVDLAISQDIARNGGRFAPQIVGIANLIILLVLAVGVLLLNRRVNKEEVQSEIEPLQLVRGASSEAMDEESIREMAELLKRMDAAIIERKLYRDPDLSLDRLSRKLLIPARQISLAVNGQRAINVSQYINLFRVMEAAYLIKTEQHSITEVIYEVGFNTKSNFNREFKRIVGSSPSEWRKRMECEEGTPMHSFQQEIADQVAWEPAQALAVSA